MAKKKNNNPILKFIRDNSFLLTILFALFGFYLTTFVAPIRQEVSVLARDVAGVKGDVQELKMMLVPRSEFDLLYDRMDRIENKVDRILELMGDFSKE